MNRVQIPSPIEYPHYYI